MKNLLFALLGYLAAVLLLQQFIIATREPFVVSCEGGEGMGGEG